MSRSIANSSPDTSQTLLARVRRQDASAWERFVTIYGPLIYRWCRQRGLQPTDAADVTQNVFAVLHRKLDRFEARPENGSFAGWLRTVTSRQIADFFRGRDPRQLPVGGETVDAVVVDDRNDSVAALAPDDRTLLIQRTISVLQGEFESRTWDAFWRAAVQRDKPRDIARELGLSVASVWQAKSRVLRRLREELAGMLEAWN